MRPRRIINIVNFIRYDDPRNPTLDLLEPIIRQMELLREAGLPCTWLLQYDALVAGPYVGFLKANLPANHEVGLWFEINRMHCDAAGVTFRGAEGVNWDYHVQAAFPVGYTPVERDHLVDAAVRSFGMIFGHAPRSVAAWYMDAHTLARFSDVHGVESFAVCRDQYGTDGYTFWGGPFSGGYYPSRRNALSPAQTSAEQIGTPVFRLLGPDPIHQYDIGLGTTWQGVLTMEPVYPEAGKNRKWVRSFLDIMACAPALSLMHAQAGQENSFGWLAMAEGYAMQVEEFVRRRDAADGEGRLEFETLGDTGRWFRQAFPASETGTPAQTVLALNDTKGGKRRSIWYHSKNYRSNLIVESAGDGASTEARLYLRDMHLFDERYAEHYLDRCCQSHAARFGTLPVLDGFGWSLSEKDRALGRWFSADRELRLSGEIEVMESDDEAGRLVVRFPVEGNDAIMVTFTETGWSAAMRSGKTLRLAVRWTQSAVTAFQSITQTVAGVSEPMLRFNHEKFPYALKLSCGGAEAVANGFDVLGLPGPAGDGGIAFAIIDRA